MRHPAWLWGAFATVHVILAVLALHGPGNPLGDVEYVYPYWVQNGIATGQWVGIQAPWVYPALALAPMVLARAFGEQPYAVMFLVLASLAHAAALAVLIGRRPSPRRVRIGWGWTAFLLLLGPVAIGRIDAFATALAIAGLVVLARRPRIAALLLTLGAWIKVWPAALVAGIVVADARRRAVAVVAGVVSVAIAGSVLILGGNPFSFLGAQSGRGLQLESAFAVPFLVGGPAGGWSVYYDTDLLTYQLRGPGVDTVAAVTTPLAAVLVVVILVVAGVAAGRGADPVSLVPWTALALTATLIAVNKVGSPQFTGWLVGSGVGGLLAVGFGTRAGFCLPAVAGLLLAGLTQLIYPGLYDALVTLQPGMILVLALRNAVELALAVGAVVALVRIALRASVPYRLPEGAPS